jgi:hypothetical protein
MQIVGSEHQRHEVDFLHTDAVLACDTSSQTDAFRKDFMTGSENPLHLIRIALVEHENGVDVTISGMEDIADP